MATFMYLAVFKKFLEGEQTSLLLWTVSNKNDLSLKPKSTDCYA
jgi:hypothetical protein